MSHPRAVTMVLPPTESMVHVMLHAVTMVPLLPEPTLLVISHTVTMHL